MRMDWLNLCFMHWKVEADVLAATLPRGLELDTRSGQAWLAIVPFQMAGVAPRLSPDIPGVSAFPELNVRTYVTADGVPGVWFSSLDAGNPLAVRMARQFFHLPYFDARMWVHQEQDITHYASMRTHRGAPEGRLAAAYQPISTPFQAAPGTLEDWLTNRLYLYSADQRGRVYRGRVAHAPWPLQHARAVINENTLTDRLGVKLEGEPHLLYAKALKVKAWMIERVK